ncbi:HAD family phosphatase [Lysinibacillus fusiformis]
MKKAYCFDLDGTITRQEILPGISRKSDLYDEISALTEATIKGIIPFETSFLLRCRLLKDVPISEVQKVVRNIEMHEQIVNFIKERKEQCFIVTGNLDVWIKTLIEEIGCGFYSSIADFQNDSLNGVRSIINKQDAIKEIKKNFDVVIAVGDGMGDVSMFEESDVGIAFGSVHNPIQSLIEVSDYIVFEEKSLCRLLNTL